MRTLRLALVRAWKWLRDRRDRQLADEGYHAPGGGRPDARSRFWAELRNGQREADARAAATRGDL